MRWTYSWATMHNSVNSSIYSHTIFSSDECLKWTVNLIYDITVILVQTGQLSFIIMKCFESSPLFMIYLLVQHRYRTHYADVNSLRFIDQSRLINAFLDSVLPNWGLIATYKWSVMENKVFLFFLPIVAFLFSFSTFKLNNDFKLAVFISSWCCYIAKKHFKILILLHFLFHYAEPIVW